MVDDLRSQLDDVHRSATNERQARLAAEQALRQEQDVARHHQKIASDANEFVP